MSQVFICVAFFLAEIGTYGQAFEVASIKPVESPLAGVGLKSGVARIGCEGGPGTKDPGLFKCSFGNLLVLVMQAYDLQRHQLTAPDWMVGAWFDVAAKVPQDTTPEQFRAMLKNFLAERFKMVVHRETKEMQVYNLVIARGGPRLKSSVEKPASSAEDPQPEPPASNAEPTFDKDGFMVRVTPRLLRKGGVEVGIGGKARIHGEGETMLDLSERLSILVHAPVADATGLKGKYDYALVFDLALAGGGRGNPSAVSTTNTPLSSASDNDSGMSIESGLQSQLGLKLDKKKGPVEIVVIDRAERTPTAN
jgi:uncharacterized protein (TIGR03435 family)